MPFYEYECASCKFYTEVMQKISDPPLEKCPSCGKKALKKLVSAPVFRLKGGGWYETDFKSDKEGKRNIADREEPAAKSEDSKSADAKPAAAGESAAKSPTAGAEAAPKAGAAGSRSSGDSGGGKRAGAKRAAPARAVARSTAKPASKGRRKSPVRKKGRR